MKKITNPIIRLLLTLLIVFMTFSPGNSSEIDDSTVFVEAFNAFQQKDYLLTIEKCDQLIQAFPDSPLRDVTLLLVARASFKSGDNERAAKSIALFTNEFPESSLKTSVEDELKTLVSRHQKGEALAANKLLQTAANKVRTDRLARERAAALKLEAERAARAKAEQERLARIKLEEERIERERVLAEKLAKESIKAVIAFREETGSFPVGVNGALPVEISNKGKNREEFLLTVAADKEHAAFLTKESETGEEVSRITLDAGETFRGSVLLKMPSDLVDGHRSVVMIKAVSAKFSDISFQKDAKVVSSAPLVRAVAKLVKQKVTPGEKLNYRVTVLNAGSLPARNLTVRLQLPPQVEFLQAPDIPFKQERNGTLVFTVDQVDIGKLAVITMDVKINENSVAGQELRGNVEIINGNLQRKDLFTATASVVQAK